MTVFRSLQIAIWACHGTLTHWSKARLWFPFILVLAVQLGGLWLIVSFHYSGVNWLALPFIRSVGGDAATHYPHLYFFLPVLYGRFNLVLALLLSSVAYGAATLQFAGTFGRNEGTPPWKLSLRRYPALVALGAVVAALAYAVIALQGLLPRSFVEGRMGRVGAEVGSLAAIILLQSLLAYSSAWILLEGRRFLSALRDSARLALSAFLPTILLVGLPLALVFPLNLLAQRPDWVVTKFRPELLATALAAQSIIEAGLAFVATGAVTRVFLWRLGEAS